MQLNPLPNTNPRAAAFQMCACVRVVNEFLDVYRAKSEDDDDEYKPQVDVSKFQDEPSNVSYCRWLEFFFSPRLMRSLAFGVTRHGQSVKAPNRRSRLRRHGHVKRFLLLLMMMMMLWLFVE